MQVSSVSFPLLVPGISGTKEEEMYHFFKTKAEKAEPRDWIVTLQVDEVYANYLMLVDTFPQLLKIVVS